MTALGALKSSARESATSTSSMRPQRTNSRALTFGKDQSFTNRRTPDPPDDAPESRATPRSTSTAPNPTAQVTNLTNPTMPQSAQEREESQGDLSRPVRRAARCTTWSRNGLNRY